MIHAVKRNMAFLVGRKKRFTIQCIIAVQPDFISRNMVKYALGLSLESIVGTEWVVFMPIIPSKGAT